MGNWLSKFCLSFHGHCPLLGGRQPVVFPVLSDDAPPDQYYSVVLHLPSALITGCSTRIVHLHYLAFISNPGGGVLSCRLLTLLLGPSLGELAAPFKEVCSACLQFLDI